MMKMQVAFVFALALALGCNETTVNINNNGGTGGGAGSGGSAGSAGSGGVGGSAGSAGSGGVGGSAGSAGSGGVGGIGGGVGCVYGAQEQDAITCINGEAPTTDAGTVYFNAENCADAANTVYDLTLANADGVTEVFLWAGIENAGCEQAANRSVVREVCREVAGNPLTVGDNATVFDLTLQELVDTGIVDCTALEGQHYEIFAFRAQAPGAGDVDPSMYGITQFKVGVTLPE
jgi:hypothetical protein